MSVSNISLSLSTAMGGHLYERWSIRWGQPVAFNLLVALGALFTSACWLLLPLINRGRDTAA
jgi:hypothetical protein